MVSSASSNNPDRLPLTAFLEEIQDPVEEWNLFNCALHVAAIGSEALDFRQSASQLQQIQGDVAKRIGRDTDPFSVIECLNQVFFQELGFLPNTENYYDPANSFINCVLEQRQGIPITLCILYREIAAGVGLGLDCIGFPGHFLLSLDRGDNRLYLDVYHKGALLVESDCEELLRNTYGGKLAFKRSMLAPISNRDVVLRMLANLKQIYASQSRSDLLIRVLDRRIPLISDPVSEILERGIAHLDLHHYQLALLDFQSFVESTDDDRMRDLINPQIEQLKILASGN